MDYYTTCASPIGTLTIGCRDGQIIGLWIAGQRYFPDLSNAIQKDDHPILIQACSWLREYFAGARPDPGSLPLSPEGSQFQKAVWKQLLAIPYGETTTYGQIARAIGNNKACQAVGGAVGRNPISIIIPCHRVIGAAGGLTGYAGGLTVKEYLLSHEGTYRQRRA